MKKCQLKVKCPSFGADGQIPKKHTGFAEDISPEILIDGFMNTVKSVAIIMDDLDVPLKKRIKPLVNLEYSCDKQNTRKYSIWCRMCEWYKTRCRLWEK